MVSPNTLTDGVPKVPKGSSEGFWHFWHCLTLGTSNEPKPGGSEMEQGVYWPVKH